MDDEDGRRRWTMIDKTQAITTVDEDNNHDEDDDENNNEDCASYTNIARRICYLRNMYTKLFQQGRFSHIQLSSHQGTHTCSYSQTPIHLQSTWCLAGEY